MLSRHFFCHSILLLVALAATLLFGSQLQAQEAEAELDKIRQEVHDHSANLEILEAERRRFDLELRQLDSDLAKYRRQQERLTHELDRTKSDIAEIGALIKELEAQIAQLEVLTAQRIRAFYMVRPGRILLAQAITQGQPGNLGRHAFLLSKIKAFDQQLLEQRRNLIAQNFEKKELLEQTASRQNQLVQQIAAKHQVVKDKAARQRSVIKSLAEKQSEIEQGLVKLRAQALRLETVLRSLTGGDEPARKSAVSKDVDAGVAAPYSGKGLAGRKGELAPPVAGKVLKRFGRVKGDFAGMVFSKGLEFETGLAAPVFAVAEGKVIHLGKMPGFGEVLIVDHGERFYSIYGRLSRSLVEPGQKVELAQEIARTSSSADRGRTFYFEIRKNGVPQDPQGFFSKRL